MSETKLEDLQALSEAATPGPWGYGGRGVATSYWDGREERVIADTHIAADRAYAETDGAAWLREMRQGTADAAFIVAAVEYVRQILPTPTPRPVAAEQTTPGTGEVGSGE